MPKPRFDRRETLLLSLYAKAHADGVIKLPRDSLQQAKGARAQCYALARKVKEHRDDFPEMEAHAKVIEDVSLYVEDDARQGPCLILRRKDQDPMNIALERVLQASGARIVEAPTEMAALAGIAARVAAVQAEVDAAERAAKAGEAQERPLPTGLSAEAQAELNSILQVSAVKVDPEELARVKARYNLKD